MSSLSAIILCRTQQPGNIGSVTRHGKLWFHPIDFGRSANGMATDHNLLNMSNGYIDKLEHIQVVDNEELSGQLAD